MKAPYFVAIDFDGTVTDVDIIDAILQEFARPEWKEVEILWEQGLIGSRECLERQMAMVDRTLGQLLDYTDRFSIDETFENFVGILEDRQIPFAIVSDGFRVFIERVLENAGLMGVPIIANGLWEDQGRLITAFPYADRDCNAANCKCTAVQDLSKDRSLILIGDGQSDFCLAHKAGLVFTKKKLTAYCQRCKIPHYPFDNFADVAKFFDVKHAEAASLYSVVSGKD
ncbi:MAG TPA: MtnX-like HAD-IB family phosphatase [Nitrospirota bacterium]|nr:MtnX-like HAD-IB family phosphatase [Nitrospirota bacterium]